MSAGYPRPAARALAKLSMAGKVKLPKLPPDVQWGGVKPPAAGFERFYNPTIRSMLTVPSVWHGFEFDQEFNNGIKARNVVCAKEDVVDIAGQGFFDTGVTFTIMTASDKDVLGQLAEALKRTTEKEIQKKIGGSTDWMQYCETAQICSLRYTSHSPDVQFHTGAIAPAKTMIYVQDLFFEKEHGLIFRMKYESPEEQFDDAKNLFEGIKTSSYFALDNDGENGIAFLEL